PMQNDTLFFLFADYDEPYQGSFGGGMDNFRGTYSTLEAAMEDFGDPQEMCPAPKHFWAQIATIRDGKLVTVMETTNLDKKHTRFAWSAVEDYTPDTR